MTLKSQAVSGVKWTSISMGAVTALHFLSLAVLANILSPADFGLMGMIMVVIGFARSFADMGVSNAIIHRQNSTKEQLSSLYWLNIFAGAIVFGLLCASTPIVVRFYNEPRLSDLLYLTAVIFLITPIGQQFQILLQKELRFNLLAKIEITISVINSLVAISLALTGFGVLSLIWGQLTATTAKVALLWGVCWKKWLPSLHFSKKDLKGYIGFGLYQMGERAVNYFNSNLDYLLVGSMLGATTLGYYSLAYNLIIRPSTTINPVITKVAFPVFSLIQNEPVKLRRGYLKVLQLLSVINFPMMIGLAVVAPVAVPVIFGEQWMPSVILIQILAIVGVLRSIGNPVGSLLLAKGRADLGFNWNFGWTILMVPGIYLGTKFGGATGVAIAYSILMGLGSILGYFVLIRTLLGPCALQYFLAMWPSFWMSCFMGVVVYLMGVILPYSSTFVLLIIQVLLGVVIFTCLALCTQKILVNELKGMIFKKPDDSMQ